MPWWPTGERSTAECVELLETLEIPLRKLNSMDSLLDDPHLTASGFFRSMEHPSQGRLRMPSPPTRFSEGENEPGPAPRLGEHSREILSELGYPPERIGGMFAAGISAEPPPAVA